MSGIRAGKVKDCINPLCCCSFEVENMLDFFLHCQHYSTFCMGLMSKVNQINESFSYLSDDNKVSLLLYGDSRFDDNKNNLILSASITYILETERFSTSLFQSDVFFNFTLILLFISSDTFHLVILFVILLMFPFLITKYQLGYCWMYLYFRFCSLCISFRRKKNRILSDDFLVLAELYQGSMLSTLLFNAGSTI